jgi:hypothetical protein
LQLIGKAKIEDGVEAEEDGLAAILARGVLPDIAIDDVV